MLLRAEDTLSTLYSFDLAEPNYRRCLANALSHPDLKGDFVAVLIHLYEGGNLSSEPIAYLMHVLRWQEIKSWAEQSLRNQLHPIATGAPIDKILSAFTDDWGNRDLYSQL